MANTLTMKTILVLFCVLFSLPVWSQDAPEQTLIRMENEGLDAIVRKDTSMISKLYDDSFQGVLASGHAVNKAGVIEFHLSGSPHIQIGIDDVKAIAFGDVGITTGKLINRSKSGTVIGQSRFMHVYRKTSTGWRIIRGQGTIVVVD